METRKKSKERKKINGVSYVRGRTVEVFVKGLLRAIRG
jgi:hypothetical protein